MMATGHRRSALCTLSYLRPRRLGLANVHCSLADVDDVHPAFHLPILTPTAAAAVRFTSSANSSSPPIGSTTISRSACSSLRVGLRARHCCPQAWESTSRANVVRERRRPCAGHARCHGVNGENRLTAYQFARCVKCTPRFLGSGSTRTLPRSSRGLNSVSNSYWLEV
ncbi:hypothetical protein H4582DRAFT_1942385 [Lactarius indigo]|nr:hypothetical protein H4582DRAFT_1942385 [Lactarius indigo]